MLARTPATLVYLSAEELGITARERAGLIEVRDDLASGRVKHVKNVRDAYARDPGATQFNMSLWWGETDCGTSHCIGGFMAARGVWGSGFFQESIALRSLFYAKLIGIQRLQDGLTVIEAVSAIDLFLSGAGSDCWPMALSEERFDDNEAV